jgi:hypothetical protein
MSADELAASIRDELTQAGLVVLPPDPLGLADRHSGVQVEVDDDEVFVTWEIGPQLRRAGLDAMRRGAYRGDDLHVSMRYGSDVTAIMNAAVAEILGKLGYEVRHDTHEYRPLELLVVSHRKVAHWRDPVSATQDGAAGFMPGVRVRLLTGELAGWP